MKIKLEKTAIGLRIKQIRYNKGYTLEAFGKLFNVSKSNVSKWEKGLSLPNNERMSTIAKIADITVNELKYGSVEEFISNNTDELLKLAGFPFPKTFEMFDIKTGIKEHIKYEEEHYNKIVTINDIDNLVKIFSEFISDVVEQKIANEIDNTIKLLENDKNKTILLLKECEEDLRDLNNKLCPIKLYLLKKDPMKFCNSFIKLLKENLLAKVNYYPIFSYIVNKLIPFDNKLLSRVISEVAEESLSRIKSRNIDFKILENVLVDEIDKLVQSVVKNLYTKDRSE